MAYDTIDPGPYPSTEDYNYPDKFDLDSAYEGQPANGTLTLYEGIPFDPDYNNTTIFRNEDAQTSYFNNFGFVARLNRNQYLRHSTDSFKVNLSMYEINRCNYIRFFNDNDTYPSGESVEPTNEARPYYAFITDIEYVSKHVSIVKFQLDVIQTYQTNFKFNRCFIERMHVSKSVDKPGLWLLDEGLPCGERMQYDFYTLSNAPFASNEYSNAIFYADINNVPAPPSGDTGPYRSNAKLGGGIYGVTCNIMSGIKVEIYNNPADCANRLSAITEAGASDSVICVVQLPKAFMNAMLNTAFSDSFRQPERSVINVDTNPFEERNGSYYGAFGNFIPKNNKLYTSPYYGLLGTSSSGDSHTYAFEDFDASESGAYAHSNAATFEMQFSLSPTPSVSAVPRWYRGVAKMYEDELECSDFPQCVYATDSYRAWVAQNSNRVQFGIKQAGVNRDFAQGANALGAIGQVMDTATNFMIGNAAATVAGLGATNFVGQTAATYQNQANYLRAGTGLLSTLLNTPYNVMKTDSDYQMALGAMQAQILDAQKLPDKSRGSAGAYANYARNTVGFMFYKYHIKEEFARIIDKFFDFYGYKVNTVDIPNPRTRAHWTYIKTAVCNIKNNGVPAKYEQEIKQIMNRGITFWIRPDEIGDYSLNNNEDY